LPDERQAAITRDKNALGGLDVELTPQVLLRIERAVPADAVVGTRYGAPLMKYLDSELSA